MTCMCSVTCVAVSVSKQPYDNVHLAVQQYNVMYGRTNVCVCVCVIRVLTQGKNIVNFDPALLPIQPSDEVVNVSYGIQSYDANSYRPEEVVNIVLDTPYNVRDVSRSRCYFFILSTNPIMNCIPLLHIILYASRTDSKLGEFVFHLVSAQTLLTCTIIAFMYMYVCIMSKAMWSWMFAECTHINSSHSCMYTPHKQN